ncbi:MAG: hydrogenase maturation protease [Eggerthellaceae bacterium]
MRIAVFFVGNRLMLDDGVGPAVYDFIHEQYQLPDEVDLFDVGCMSLDMVSKVNDYDLLISVDAVEGTDAEPGTVFRYEPFDIARAQGARTSLHDLKLADLFDAASLLGYKAEGLCFGMQVENMEPSEFVVGLTPRVEAQVPFLAETVIAELVRRGCQVVDKDKGLLTL